MHQMFIFNHLNYRSHLMIPSHQTHYGTWLLFTVRTQKFYKNLEEQKQHCLKKRRRIQQPIGTFSWCGLKWARCTTTRWSALQSWPAPGFCLQSLKAKERQQRIVKWEGPYDRFYDLMLLWKWISPKFGVTFSNWLSVAVAFSERKVASSAVSCCSGQKHEKKNAWFILLKTRLEMCIVQ